MNRKSVIQYVLTVVSIHMPFFLLRILLHRVVEAQRMKLFLELSNGDVNISVTYIKFSSKDVFHCQPNVDAT